VKYLTFLAHHPMKVWRWRRSSLSCHLMKNTLQERNLWRKEMSWRTGILSNNILFDFDYKVKLLLPVQSYFVLYTSVCCGISEANDRFLAFLFSF
jgi:hypothetical protein